MLSMPFKLGSPLIYSIARNKEAKVADYWSWAMEGGGWAVNLQRNLNDWELEHMTSLLGRWTRRTLDEGLCVEMVSSRSNLA